MIQQGMVSELSPKDVMPELKSNTTNQENTVDCGCTDASTTRPSA